MDFANENLADSISNAKGIQINIGGVEYLLTNYYQKPIDRSYIGLYNQQPT